MAWWTNALIFYGKVQSNQSVNASTKRSEPLKTIVDQNMAKTKSLIKQPRIHPNLCQQPSYVFFKKLMASSAVSQSSGTGTKPLFGTKTRAIRVRQASRLFFETARCEIETNSCWRRKKYISSNIMLDCVKWSEMHCLHCGLAWVVRDSPTNVWALVAGLSLLMLPSLFRSLDACRGVHLEKSRHDNTGHKEQPSMGHPWKTERYCKKMCHFVVDLSQSRYQCFWPYINQHIFLVLAAPAFASPDATCPGTDSTSPFNKITQWRLKEKDRNNNQSKLKQKTTNSEFSLHYLDLAATVNGMARFRSPKGYRRPIRIQLQEYGHLAGGKAISDRTPAISEQHWASSAFSGDAEGSMHRKAFYKPFETTKLFH